jgi:CHASE2 domain-containing sensor protein
VIGDGRAGLGQSGMIEAEGSLAKPGRHGLPAKNRIGKILRNSMLRALLSAQVIAALVVVVRDHGWLRPAELAIYDALRVVWARPAPADDVLLVGMTESDIQRWHYPLSDDLLADLLVRLASRHPRAIGVDIYRDMPVEPSTGKLAAVLKAHPEIYWVFKLAEGRDDSHPGIKPPPELVGSDRGACRYSRRSGRCRAARPALRR